MIDSLLPVGRDCDCGHPLVWRDGKQWCPVYGRHPTPGQIVRFRIPEAPGARLVDEITAMHRCASQLDRDRATRHLQAHPG